ncbi:hypothetical protein AX15_006392 [Amanita polypyramis BW_CC]|nr:hypothetical protein AX15_006392 [Amanita polypyramis BW_CC]
MKDTDKKRKRDSDEASEHGTPPEKRNRDDKAYQVRHDTTAQSRSGPSMPPSPTPPPPSGSKGKGKMRDPDDETYQDPNEKTAQKLVQQAWAQAVRVDGTVIVLHSGNQELVCLRHRQSQTLYVSELIVPSTCSDPGYGKLHIGIYIAAIQDMMDRWQHRAESKPSGDGGDGGGDDGGEDQDGQDHSRGSGSIHKGGYDSRGRRKGRGRGRGRGGNSGRSRGSSGRKRPTCDELAAIERAMDAASNRDVVLLYLQYDVYDSPIPASFLRSAPSIMAHTRCSPPFSPRALRSYELEECLTIVLTSEIGRGATGVVHGGTLKSEVLGGAISLDVVVKLAFDSEQQDALRSEYEVYRHLKSKRVHQGITTALGIFDDSKGNLSISDCKSALSTLKSIHGAGTLHGDIRRANILIGDLGITIIDFGHSKQCDDQEAKDKEMARLRYCLHLEGED